MSFEVFSPFYRCQDLHGVHRRLKDAADCLAEITQSNNGENPVNPLTGKYIHAIAAVDDAGTIRDLGKNEKRWVRGLGLDPQSVWIEKPNVTTIHNLARLHYEACRSLPLLSIDLGGLFDQVDNRRHFWNTDAGKGQCIAHIAQAAFSLELSIKAILEVDGKLIEPTDGSKPAWRDHSPVQLLDQLDKSQQQMLERVWRSAPVENRHFSGSYLEFLQSVDGLYKGVRYFDKRLDVSKVQVELASLMCASRVALNFAFQLSRENAPLKPNVTTMVYLDSTQSSVRRILVQGVVRSVDVPEGFDPHAQVKVVIEPNDDSPAVTALFRKADVEHYFNLRGNSVSISGYEKDTDPLVLHGSNHPDWDYRQRSGPTYTTEFRTLKGTVFDLQRCEIGIDSGAFRLVLEDSTFFTKVECFFSACSEKAQLSKIHLGDEVFISGLVSLRDGRPMVLMAPTIAKYDNSEKFDDC